MKRKIYEKSFCCFHHSCNRAVKSLELWHLFLQCKERMMHDQKEVLMLLKSDLVSQLYPSVFTWYCGGEGGGWNLIIVILKDHVQILSLLHIPCYLRLMSWISIILYIYICIILSVYINIVPFIIWKVLCFISFLLFFFYWCYFLIRGWRICGCTVPSVYNQQRGSVCAQKTYEHNDKDLNHLH